MSLKPWVVAACLCASLVGPRFARAQTPTARPAAAPAQPAAPRPGRLLVTVTDQTGGVLPQVMVTIAGLEDVTKRVRVEPKQTDDRGVATFENVALGRYSIQSDLTGFTPGLVKDYRVRSGDNRQTVVLNVSMTDSVTVGPDRQESAADRSSSFGTALTREQVDSLSEDPTELRNQLLGMAGDPNAVIRVDSFEGQDLPPKAQIKSVRITRDQFSAENHYAGGISIEIITQPGIGPLRGQTRLGYYNSALDGVNALTQRKGPQQNRNVGGTLGGSLLKDRASFSLSLNGTNSYSTPPLFLVQPDGTRVSSYGLRQPQTNASESLSLDYALTKDQTLRFGVSHNNSNRRNQGIGQYDEIERAFSSTNSGTSVRLQHVGPIGRRFFLNDRMLVSFNDSASHSTVDALTYVVNDAFTSGGAQQTGGTQTKNISLGADMDYVRGRNAVRAGVQIDGTRYHTNANSNYLGTYTFSSLDAFNAGLPTSYTQRIGDPTIQYWNFQAGFYILDDIRLRKNLTITPGLRYEVQTHLADRNNVGPRFGVTWAPFKSGHTTLRASWGIFYDWLSTGTYEQTLRFNGQSQQSVNLANPSFPNPGALTAGAPGDRYILGPNLKMPWTMRLSAGVQQTINAYFNIGATYSDSRGHDLFVGQNLNTPVNGVRPDPTSANIYEAITGGRSRQRSLSVNWTYNIINPQVAANSTAWFDWRRSLQIYGSYGIGDALNDTNGPFSTPADGIVADDWGPSGEDVRHRGSLQFYSGAIRNFSASIGISASSARPLNITTGLDGNGDLIFNDRPAGVGRNSARQAPNYSSFGSFTYSFNLGHRLVNSGGGVSITSTGGVLTANVMGGQAVPRYRMQINVNVSNLTNYANLTGYSGNMTSPNFLKPTNANGVRTVNFNAYLSF